MHCPNVRSMAVRWITARHHRWQSEFVHITTLKRATPYWLWPPISCGPQRTLGRLDPVSTIQPVVQPVWGPFTLRANTRASARIRARVGCNRTDWKQWDVHTDTSPHRYAPLRLPLRVNSHLATEICNRPIANFCRQRFLFELNSIFLNYAVKNCVVKYWLCDNVFVRKFV